MALRPCPECGNEVSDKASSCPECGHPLSAAAAGATSSAPAASPAVVTVERNKHPVLTFIGGAVLVVFVIAVVVGLMDESAAGDEVQFNAIDALLDENCTELGDYCVQVHCTVQNVGTAAGEESVMARLLGPNDRVMAERRQSLTLLPNATQRVTFRFSEALLEWGTVMGQCSVE